MNKIEFTFAVDSDNKDHMLIIGEMFLKLGGAGEVAPVATEKIKKAAKTEPAKTEPAKTEPAKTEPETELTIEALRAKGFSLATAKPAAKDAIGNWLSSRGIKGVPAIPKEMFNEYNEFLNTL